MALLPLRAAFAGGTGMGGEGLEMGAMPGCASMTTLANGDMDPACPGSLGGDSDPGGCCGDHCGGSLQVPASTRAEHRFPAAPPRHEERIITLLEVFLSPEQRPPLNHS